MLSSPIVFPFCYFLKREYQSNNAGWLGRSARPAQGSERPESVPLVQSGGPQRPLDVLFSVVRGRVAFAQRPGLHSREGTGTRSRRLRRLPCRLSACRAATEASEGRGAAESLSRVG